MVNELQAERIKSGKGIIAALDQSGGSIINVLRLYGIEKESYSSDQEMFDLIHQMRRRILTSPVLSCERVLGAILFEQTMEQTIDGVAMPRYLWNVKGIASILKLDQGLADVVDDAQLVKPMPWLDDLLHRAVQHGIFGTKQRSVIGAANSRGIAAVVAQQFDIAHRVFAYDLVPTVEPEVTISIPDKAQAEAVLLDEITQHLESVPDGKGVVLKLALPSETNLYRPLIHHPKVFRVTALSGGYSRDEANERLTLNRGMIASFSRALTEGLSIAQSDDQFDAALDEAIQSIYAASN